MTADYYWISAQENIRDLRQGNALNTMWWQVLSIGKLCQVASLSTERTDHHILFKASSCLRSLLSCSVSCEVIVIALTCCYCLNAQLDVYAINCHIYVMTRNCSRSLRVIASVLADSLWVVLATTRNPLKSECMWEERLITVKLGLSNRDLLSIPNYCGNHRSASKGFGWCTVISNKQFISQ